ncbi:MAG: recombinase family protein [Euryarchaeota archaeon]|nr:recombinase family protein [Euryarchaeota archaeon]
MIRVVVYARVSTKEQEKEDTVETQIDKLTPLILQSGDREIVRIVKDEDVSGDTEPEQRKHFPVVLDMAEKGDFDELWLASRDRLARDVDIAGYIRTVLRRHGVKIVALDDSDEKTFDRFKDVLGEMELEKYRAKRLDGINRAIKEHRILQRPPFGYMVQEKKMVVDERHRGIIVALYRDFKLPAMSLRKLSQKYNLPPSLIQRIRSNTIYITGEVRWQGRVIYHVEPIVKEEEVVKSQKT